MFAFEYKINTILMLESAIAVIGSSRGFKHGIHNVFCFDLSCLTQTANELYTEVRAQGFQYIELVKMCIQNIKSSLMSMSANASVCVCMSLCVCVCVYMFLCDVPLFGCNDDKYYPEV